MSLAELMALCLEEVEPNSKRLFLYTPTGDELPDMVKHMERMKILIGRHKFIKLKVPTLREIIKELNCIPNYRMRFCTRIIKIEPCIEYLRKLDNPILCVGLRYDEPMREGLYDKHITNRYPLREWEWNVNDVWAYLKYHNVKIPPRTNCAMCYYQKNIDWYNLWKQYPEIYDCASNLEIKYKHTFRFPSKDKHPTSLYDMREAFKKGWIPKFQKQKTELRRGCRIGSM